MSVQLSSLLGQKNTDVVIKAGGAKFGAKILNLNASPEAERIRQAAVKATMEDGKMRSPADMMPDFADKERDDIALGKLAVKGWTMTMADYYRLMPDDDKCQSGVESLQYIPGVDEPIKVVVRSGNTKQHRELAYGWNKRALRKNETTNFIPPREAQIDIKVDRLKRLIASWDLMQGENPVPIEEGFLNQICISSKDFPDGILEDADNEEQFSIASGMNEEELAAAASQPYEFSEENLEKLLRNSITFREKIMKVADNEGKFRKAATEKAEDIAQK